MGYFAWLILGALSRLIASMFMDKDSEMYAFLYYCI